MLLVKYGKMYLQLDEDTIVPILDAEGNHQEEDETQERWAYCHKTDTWELRLANGGAASYH